MAGSLHHLISIEPIFDSFTDFVLDEVDLILTDYKFLGITSHSTILGIFPIAYIQTGKSVGRRLPLKVITVKRAFHADFSRLFLIESGYPHKLLGFDLDSILVY
mmetsp:Transcript_16326/g.15670  ORF Transcript_16326/g.15670 Transcript_16326/m.15670 type:complete len:104 (-) Transcript_16326:99-410(-)